MFIYYSRLIVTFFYSFLLLLCIFGYQVPESVYDEPFLVWGHQNKISLSVIDIFIYQGQNFILNVKELPRVITV